MPSPAHIQAATLQKFLAGWKKFTAEEWMATWSTDSRQKLLPFSLGVPSRSRTEVQQVLPKLIGVLNNYEMEIHEVVHDASKGKAAVYIISKADTPFEGNFKWTNEYAVFLTFTEDGQEICKMEEMVDTAFYQEFSPRFQKYLTEQGLSH
ncbi:hypothetical protein N7450_001305 [Penicillium hetheringtonii]|uniref:Uncharacterized protein n=1 Tax=Penicillium hetheringtonii TaxID=911720 RepID=A0AAD6E547_9EURO|nr:hypothetical protein N7450_001305 [Penicillium hetheringtonii]